MDYLDIKIPSKEELLRVLRYIRDNRQENGAGIGNSDSSIAVHLWFNGLVYRRLIVGDGLMQEKVGLERWGLTALGDDLLQKEENNEQAS